MPIRWWCGISERAALVVAAVCSEGTEKEAVRGGGSVRGSGGGEGCGIFVHVAVVRGVTLCDVKIRDEQRGCGLGGGAIKHAWGGARRRRVWAVAPGLHVDR